MLPIECPYLTSMAKMNVIENNKTFSRLEISIAEKTNRDLVIPIPGRITVSSHARNSSANERCCICDIIYIITFIIYNISLLIVISMWETD